jgi:hypothetical protein
VKKILKKLAAVVISDEIIKHLQDAITEKSYFDLHMAANLIKNNEKEIKETFGWEPSAILSLYADVSGNYRQNGYDENNRELPEWCIETLTNLVRQVFFKKNTIDAVGEAEQNLKQKDQEVVQLKKEIDKSLDDGDQEKFKELTDRLRKIEGSKKRLIKKTV